MDEQKDLDRKIEQSFQLGNDALPEDKYFKKIWDSIENRAPVGEKYYLRSFFALFFFLAAVVIFVLFYSDFLSSILTLKEIQKENAAFFSSSTSLLDSRFNSPSSFKEFEIAKDVMITSMKESKLILKPVNNESVELDFYSGHIIIDKRDSTKSLIIHMPDLKLVFNPGGNKCNVFCYDNIIRIIPLSLPVVVEFNGKQKTVSPPSSFFLLNNTYFLERRILRTPVSKELLIE